MKLFQDIATYAIRGNGKYMLFFGALISVFSDLASIAGGLISLISWVFLSGYLCAAFYDIVNSTATGDDEAPDFPEISNLLEEVVEPFLHVFAVALVAMGPCLAYLIFLDEEAGNQWVFYGLLGFGVVYFPMALLAVVILGRLGGMSPHIVLPAIFRGGWLYWVAVLLMGLLYTTQVLVSGAFAGHPIPGSLVASVLGMFTLMTSGRVLGIVYRDREEKLDWL